MALLINGAEVDPSTLAPTAEQLAIQWKDAELKRTDEFMSLPDYDYIDELTLYRRQLKDWSDSEGFPFERPLMPLTPKGKPIA